MLDTSDLFETRDDDQVVLELGHGYTHSISLHRPEFTFCDDCLELDAFHIADGVCVVCGYTIPGSS